MNDINTFKRCAEEFLELAAGVNRLIAERELILEKLSVNKTALISQIYRGGDIYTKFKTLKSMIGESKNE
jgi:hypothetical protein